MSIQECFGNVILNLHLDIYNCIFKNLSVKDLAQVAQVSKLWNNLSQTNSIWVARIEKDFADCFDYKGSDECAKQIYRDHVKLHKTTEITLNALADVICWLKKGDYVVVHEGELWGRTFHKCQKQDVNGTQLEMELKKLRVMYLDVDKVAGVLKENQWPWYIKNEGFDECSCSLQEPTLSPENIIHKVELVLN